jgi:aminopeptidase YwaD
MDMIGRLDEKTKTLMINGTGTSAVWESLLQELSHERINIKTDSSGIGPSDHTSFYLKNIPALHFFTGAHADYHKPTDDWDKINFTGQAEVLSLIARVIDRLDVQPRLTFLPTRTKPMATRSAFKVTLGIMPSYASEGEGLRVDGVTEGKPGDLAGIQTGDVIIQMGDYPVKDIYAYMDALGKFTKGETTVVKVLRGKEELTLYVTF